MAVRQPGVWGIDLGQCALKAIRLEMKDGEVVATAFEYIEHPKILSQPDADPDELTREALGQFLSRNSIAGDIVAIAVPGQSGLARFVKLPPVDQKKVAEIVKFEAKQQIPFPLEEVVWDFQPLSTGEIVDGMALETEIGLFAMKRDMVNRAIHQFKEVNVEVHLVQMAPLGLCNFVSYDLLGKDASTGLADDGDHSCIVALELGTDNSNLVITDGGKIIWQRPIPIGGNHFTRALTKELKLTFAKAEHLKRNAAKSPDLKKILSALKQTLNDFVGEVQRSLGYFTNTHRNASIQYMIGLGNAFRLPGLQKFLQEKLQLEVRKLQHLERTTGESVTSAPTFSENIMSFAVAYGLALQGLKQARLQTNLLPHEVRLERIIRGKKPWVVSAAACLLFGMFMLAFARGMEKDGVENAAIAKNKAEAKRVVDEAKRLNKEADDEKAKLTKSIDSLDRIGAGVNERLNWQLLHEYINLALPQPNGDRLAKKSKKSRFVWDDYWNKDPDAKKAFGYLEEMRIQTGDGINPDESAQRDLFMKQHLIQINIVGINAVYLDKDDLGPYFRKLQKDRNALPGMTDEDRAEVIKFVADAADPVKMAQNPVYKAGPGWVVELRGFTYHQKKDRFVEDTIIENLKFPHQIKDAQLKQQVEDKVSYLTIYQQATEEKPVAGQFQIIGKSYLKTVAKGLPPDPGPGAGQPAPGVPNPAVGQGDPKVNRDTWRPLGDTASAVYQDIAGGAAPAAPAAAPPGTDPKNQPPAKTVPRTEFVILFLWREPITTASPNPAAVPGVPVVAVPPKN